jgi:hypothetical protein
MDALFSGIVHCNEARFIFPQRRARVGQVLARLLQLTRYRINGDP